MKDNEINVFNYLFEFIGERKIYFFIYFILIPILPIVRNFAVPEITGKIYSNINNIKKISKLLIMAERLGFEPRKELPLCRFSRPVLSTAQPSLREHLNTRLIESFQLKYLIKIFF